jgi:carbon monoxide dehydrogenase subunit G
MNLQHSLHIDAPPTRVWEVTVDVEALPDHTPTMTDVTKLDPGPLTVGSTVRIKQPAQRSKVWTVTEFEPLKRFSWTTKSAGTTMTASHDLVETPNGTTNTLTVDIEGRLAPMVGALVGRPIRRAIAIENRALKTAAESPVQQEPSEP